MLKMKWNRNSFCHSDCTELWKEFSERRGNSQTFSSRSPKTCEKLCYKLQRRRLENDGSNLWHPRKQLISFILGKQAHIARSIAAFWDKKLNIGAFVFFCWTLVSRKWYHSIYRPGDWASLSGGCVLSFFFSSHGNECQLVHAHPFVCPSRDQWPTFLK